MRQLDLTDRLLRLRGVPVLKSMTTSELAPLAATMRSAVFDKGQVILREDEPPKAFHILLTGSVVMRRHGKEIRTIKAPGAVGFLSVLARTGGGTEAVATSRTETYELRADAMGEMFEDHFSTLLGTLQWVAERIVEEGQDVAPRPYTPPEDPLDDLIGENELGIVERILLLRRTVAFRNANVNSTARLARAMKEVRAPAGTTIWRPGDRAGDTLFIVRGMMELRWHGGATVQHVGPGYAVGGGESLAHKPRWNELVTTEPVIYLRGTREALIDMLEDDIEVALQFLSMLASFLLVLWDQRAERADVSA